MPLLCPHPRRAGAGQVDASRADIGSDLLELPPHPGMYQEVRVSVKAITNASQNGISIVYFGLPQSAARTAFEPPAQILRRTGRWCWGSAPLRNRLDAIFATRGST